MLKSRKMGSGFAQQLGRVWDFQITPIKRTLRHFHSGIHPPKAGEIRKKTLKTQNISWAHIW